MSSLRNSLHRRNHKERSQLAHRARFGILEKHKDYVLRARDYHSKQDRLKRLQQKAADRNKDEFYFGMTRQRTEVRQPKFTIFLSWSTINSQGGMHVQERGNVPLPTDIVKVLKTQDGNYIRTMRMVGLKVWSIWFRSYRFSCSIVQQKIDRLKVELSTSADLIRSVVSYTEGDGNDSLDLDAEELKSLCEAGVIPRSSYTSARRKPKPTHLIFVESADEGKK
jgi:U3 small nucleolar RNA-associated protein 11